VPGHPDLIFHAAVLPEPPAFLTTDCIVFRKALHDYTETVSIRGLMTGIPEICRFSH
jgi:hypothetical protein